MPVTTKAQLKCMAEELQQKLEKAEQSKEAIEAAVRAAMTSQLEEEIPRAVAAEKKRTTSMQQKLETMQRAEESVRNEKNWQSSALRMH